MDELDLIVSSFQSMGPGAVGLHRPLVEPGFDLFDPMDERHLVLSHHAAHAYCALGTSGLSEAAVLVCDLAGSTTLDGRDFAQPFAEFEGSVTSLSFPSATSTECLSIYEGSEDGLDLKLREYCVASNAPEVFVCSVGSLYDNVARMIFGRENAHGELMALASMGSCDGADVSIPEIVECDSAGNVTFRNDWQHRVRKRGSQVDYASLAAVVQRATELALLAYAKKTRALTSARHLVAAGGLFLNIPVNSEISTAALFEEFFVPSSPHDAGIAIGCAFWGWRKVADRRTMRVRGSRRRATDRLGRTYCLRRIRGAIRARTHLVSTETHVGPGRIAELLQDGRIVARCAGRAEFGPRALGGRSLLANPLLAESKRRLNALKGRQSWRPVAPIVLRERISEFFLGPEDSPNMNFKHVVLPRHREMLEALAHPDHSVRAQTLSYDDDPYLYEVIQEFGRLTGYPVVVNTSFNGPGEPIIETPEDAIECFLARDELDYLLLEDELIRRRRNPPWHHTSLAPDTIVSMVRPSGRQRIVLLRGRISMEISADTLRVIEQLPGYMDSWVLDERVKDELVEAFRKGMLTLTKGSS